MSQIDETKRHLDTLKDKSEQLSDEEREALAENLKLILSDLQDLNKQCEDFLKEK